MKEVSNKVLYRSENSKVFAKLVDPNSADKINITEMIMSLTSKPNGQFSDRTGTFSGRYKSVISPIPDIPINFNKTFSEISSERSIELLSSGKEIIVPWSGGIDSTYTLVSLLQNCTDISQLSVIMDQYSIKENSNFYNNYINNKLNIITPTVYYPKIIPSENQIFVTGDQIPQLFGFSFVSFADFKNEPWTNWVINKIDSMEKKKWFFSNIKPWLDKSPIEIKTVFDFMWWVCFSLRWDNNRCRPLKWNIDYDKSIFENNIQPFFRTSDFEIWSMLNHDKKIKHDAASFKYVLKEEIFKFDKNENYFNNKTSGRSNLKLINHFDLDPKKLIQTDEVPLLIDDNYTYFFKSEIETSPDKFLKLLNVMDTDEWFTSPYTLKNNDFWVK
jgi:hypothetical protein